MSDDNRFLKRQSICDVHSTWLSKPGEVGAAVEHALKTGYRHIDCAQFYFNEKEIGDALQRCFKDGVVTRDQVYITSKLWWVSIPPPFLSLPQCLCPGFMRAH